jgi:hypothetical protein
MTPARRIAALALLLVLSAVAAYALLADRPAHPASHGAPSGSPPSAVPSGTSTGSGTGGAANGTWWIVSGSTLDSLVAADPATAKLLDTPNAYVLTGDAHWSVPDGWSSTPTASFTSYAALKSAFTRNSLDPRIRAVLYDNEHWSLTPQGEQADPAHYDQLAADLVHQHHLLFIAAPATDLVDKLSPQTPAGGKFDAFLQLGLLGRIAGYADLLDLQAQGAENDPTLFASFVKAATAQARAANPRLKVLAGISTNPSGAKTSATAIDRAADAVRPEVDGFWLNDPVHSPACDVCKGPLPQLTLAALRHLGQ